uniref:lipid droplet-regulating VLDL assembly factor AUP1 isoform X2 n=1 Tax=Myxine glutinosa TaxID=7769 RepID=UPI00358F5BED
MACPAIEELFVKSRFVSDPFTLFIFLVYLPFGVCLLLLRVFIGLHIFLVASALPEGTIRRIIVRVMCVVLGVILWQDDPRKRDSQTKVVVSNHVSHFDYNVLGLLSPFVTPLLEGPPSILAWARGFIDLGQQDRATLVATCRKFCSKQANPALLLFPEEACTSGKVGLLKFSSWAFAISLSVQPATLSVHRPVVAVNVLGSSWLYDLLWTFFVPCTVYQVRWLPVVTKKENQTHEEFAKLVQELLGSALALVPTPYSSADKAELIKRLAHEEHPPSAGFWPEMNTPTIPQQVPLGDPGAVGGEMQLLNKARKVKEVLPHVPLGIISVDLAQTGCVDVTITNLLEGRVHYESDEMASPQVAPSGCLQGARASLVAPVFGSTSSQRHQSLQQRKSVLLNCALSLKIRSAI